MPPYTEEERRIMQVIKAADAHLLHVANYAIAAKDCAKAIRGSSNVDERRAAMSTVELHLQNALDALRQARNLL